MTQKVSSWKRPGAAGVGRAVVVALALAAVAASDQWVIFKGQVNGPAKTRGIDLETFRSRPYPGRFWEDGYYHYLVFPDRSVITVSASFNRSEANLAFVYAKPGVKPLKSYVITDVEEAQFDDQGFGFVIGKNRVRLEGSRYTLDLDLDRTRAKIEYDLIGPSYTYGDGMVRYPDGDTFMYYSMPIPWARVHVQAVLDGKEYALDGYGNMNHDAGSMFAAYNPWNWQVFYLFGEDHALVVADHFTHEKFGRALIQRLVFVDKTGRVFTSTSYPLHWDDWAEAKGVPFRYPRHYLLKAEGQGASLSAEVKARETVLQEDLFSNLPGYMRLVAKRLIENVWTVDSWSDYTITYRHEGAAETYQGRGVVRWTNLEEEQP